MKKPAPRKAVQWAAEWKAQEITVHDVMVEPDVDINIEYIGLRPGEKLHEELITEGEGVIPTTHEKILVLKGIECNLQEVSAEIDALVKLADARDIDSIKNRLHASIPGYCHQ